MHHGRVVKRTGDGFVIEFRSVVDAVRCAIEVQNGMAERNTELPPERRIEFRVGSGSRTAEGTGLPANIIEEFRRDMTRLALVREQISSIEKTRAERLERAPDTGPHAIVRLLARGDRYRHRDGGHAGAGDPVADRDRRAVARYAGLPGSPGTPRIFRCILIRKALSGLRNANTETAELLRLTSFVAVHRAASATISS